MAYVARENFVELLIKWAALISICIRGREQNFFSDMPENASRIRCDEAVTV